MAQAFLSTWKGLLLAYFFPAKNHFSKKFVNLKLDVPSQQ
jgi:hypothetical protein